VGGGLPRVPTPWKEGGTIYLQQCHADASLGLAYIVGPHTELEADLHFTYFFQHENSHEDNNAFELIDNGAQARLTLRFLTHEATRSPNRVNGSWASAATMSRQLALTGPLGGPLSVPLLPCLADLLVPGW